MPPCSIGVCSIITCIIAMLAANVMTGAAAAEPTPTPTPPDNPGDLLAVDPVTVDGAATPAAWEDRLRARLRATTVTQELQGRPLVEAVSRLRSLGRMNLIIDPQVLAVSQQPVTLQLAGASCETALEQIVLQTRTRYLLVDDAVYLTRRAEDDGGRFVGLEQDLARTFADRAPSPAVHRIRARLDRVVTLHLAECPVEEALDLASRGLGIDLVVKPEVAALSREVSLHVEEMRGRHALNHLMRVAGLRHAFEDDVLVISAASDPSPVAARRATVAERALGIPDVTMKAEETESGTLVGFLEKIAEVPIRIDPQLAKQRLSAHFEGAPLLDALELIATMTGGGVVPLPEDPRGFLITPKAADENEPKAPSAAQ